MTDNDAFDGGAADEGTRDRGGSCPAPRTLDRDDDSGSASAGGGTWSPVRRSNRTGPGKPRKRDGSSPPGSGTPGVAIVDTSYVIFAKYYSTLSWYKTFFDPNPDVSQLLQSSVFKHKYATAFTSGIAKICNATGLSLGRVMFARDCSKDSVWRRKIMPSYKGSRTQNLTFNRDVFHYTYAHVIPEWIEGHGGCSVGADGAEADDVIGVAHRFLKAFPEFCSSIVIISNDNDCIQLSDPSTQILNLFMNDVGRRRGDLTPQQYLESRILAGDRSDNIPGLLPRCGMKTAVRLVTTGALALQTEHQKAAWARNDVLMNLQNTPPAIRGAIEEAVSRWYKTVSSQSQSVSSP